MASPRFCGLRFLVAAALLFMPPTLFAQELGPRDVDALPASAPTAVLHYGAGSLQFGELRLPLGKGPFPVAVVIHGGCWTAGLATLRNTAPIASDLTASGIATWNIEYREVGDPGGGWPGTFLDWGAAVDDLRKLAKSYPLDLSRVVVLGHSAGAHAALWVAARHRLAVGNEIRGAEPLPIQAAVAIDGPGDLTGFVGTDVELFGFAAVVPLMGGTPAEVPERYRQASPQGLLPLGVRQVLISATVLAPDKARAYQKLAQAKGDSVETLTLDTGHFEPIAPGTAAWAKVKELILKQVVQVNSRVSCAPPVRSAEPPRPGQHTHAWRNWATQARKCELDLLLFHRGGGASVLADGGSADDAVADVA